MKTTDSIRFFDAQFERQVREADFALNPFEEAALPHLHGRVLDYGCGLGNLALAAARNGCSVVALDASRAAIEHLRAAAAAQSLAIEAQEADLRSHTIEGQFDAVVSIGLLMFMECDTALRELEKLKLHVRPRGVAIVNVLVEGTTYLEMFGASERCLFKRGEIERRFEGWEKLRLEYRSFDAPGGDVKAFLTLIARKPAVSTEGA
jgi:tellurite methyltransferase